METKIISIFSNKGGVGKTFVSVNLATALALANKKVLLIDFELQAGHDMARMLNLSPRYGLVQLFSKIEQEESPEVIKKYVICHSSGIDFLPAVIHINQAGQVSPENIHFFLKKISGLYDFIIIDAGKTFSEILLSILDASKLILLVATPDILAVYQTKGCLDILQSMHYPLKMIKLVLNRSESRGGVAWQEVRSALPCEILGHIPSDGKNVGIALNRGVPCVIDSPKAKIAESFVRMAHDLVRKDSLFIGTAEIGKSRKKGETVQRAQFWDKFGLHVPGTEDSVVEEEDEVIALKKRIHEKLVERLNVQDLSPETLSDPSKALELKQTAQNIVSNLLVEEKGGIIASHEERSRLVKEIVNEALGLGALEEFLSDPDVTDIMVNGRTEVYVEKKGKLIHTRRKFVSDQQIRAIIDRIIAPLGRRIDESVPMVDARLPDGSRFNAIIPPLSLSGPMITIRKFGKERLQIDDLLHTFKSLSQEMNDFLKACVYARKNIIISGGTGAGKTTLLNVISHYIPDDERIITIEDAAELSLSKTHWGRLESRPSNVEGRGEVTIRDLFINTLRMRPDRIIIGECRGAEVLDMLQAMNTGHDGSMTTLHANSTRDVLVRMSSMILLSGIELPVRAINEMISSAIDIVVHVARLSDGSRRITGITEILGLSQDYQLELRDLFVYVPKGKTEEGIILGDYEPTGHIPQFFEDVVTMGVKLDKNIFRKPS